ncbi:MAG: glycoside hydrolase family 31 protein [Eubacteriales bacterium]|nr:glycoside hydrolase family 31 protein [Eubacteriales bacterium]
MLYQIQIQEREYWWGGTTVDGCSMPFDQDTNLEHDFQVNTPNQTMPLFLSSTGRCIWSESPFRVKIADGMFEIEGEEVTVECFGDCLADAYKGAMRKYFPPSGEYLEETFFNVPQYNTWMHLVYDQNQEGVLQYARDIVANGFKPGILMIDEGWHIDYGIWKFDLLKFPDPKAMVEQLHSMGFKVMLWVVPFVRPDGKFFVKHTDPRANTEKLENYFLRSESGDVAITKWWNGRSAVFDMTKECDRNLLDSKLISLMEEYGIDGFKFDGGTVDCYTDSSIASKGQVNRDYTPHERNAAWNDFGTKYKFHEFKDTYKGGGKRVIQRIRDREHTWDHEGLNTFVPNALAQGIIGHPFVCPDMVGGGEWIYREFNIPADQELFVRMAQASALFPMMQFSWAPWEALDTAHLSYVKQAHDLHCDFSEIIRDLVAAAYETGEPIMRYLEYNYPHCGYEKVNDVFMLGDEYLGAPVLAQGQLVKKIPLPEGTWLGFDGNEYVGGRTLDLPVTIETLPWFRKRQ